MALSKKFAAGLPSTFEEVVANKSIRPRKLGAKTFMPFCLWIVAVVGSDAQMRINDITKPEMVFI